MCCSGKLVARVFPLESVLKKKMLKSVKNKIKIHFSCFLAAFVSCVSHFQAHAEVSQWSTEGKAKPLPFFSK